LTVLRITDISTDMKGRELNRLKRNQWERTGTKIRTKRD
jgi:hypothetical protein